MSARQTDKKAARPSLWGVVLVGLLSCGCEPPLDIPQPDSEPQREIHVHGASTDGGTAQVVRFEVPQSDPDSLRLFEGSLTEYYERRVRERDLPESLLARQIPAFTWDGTLEGAPGTAWLGPTEALTVGQRYSLAALGTGLLLEIDVALEQPQYARRLWPPQQASGRLAVFCADTPVAADEVRLDGCPFSASISSGIEESGALSVECFTLAMRESSVNNCLAPLRVGELWLPSTTLGGLESAESEPVECEGREQRFGNGCALVGDSYVALRRPTDEMWVLSLSDRTLGPIVGDSLVIRELESQRDYSYSLISVDRAGNSARTTGKLVTLAAGPQVVLNEVLANANGPEPAQEWIEVSNVGSRVASLEGLVLEDGAGEVELPSARLEPGEYALLVTPEYDRAYPFDLSPSKDVRLIVVEQLGRSGLSNSGEPLILRGASGELLSAIPPLKHDKPGYSVARRAPELTDVLTSFQTHGEPGASPGQANHFDTGAD